jgi:hypothetical protein
MFTQFIRMEERAMSVRSEIASDVATDIGFMRNAALADIRARIGTLVADVERAARDIGNVDISVEQLLLAGQQVEDAIDDLLHDLRNDLAEIERGDA